MSRIFIAGLGAVSPAGWDVAAMREALRQGKALPPQSLERPGGTQVPAHLVPAPDRRPEFLSHPRLRRTSPISHYAASAALEAMAGIEPGGLESARIGLIVAVQSGCVQYSCRFYDEVLKNPATASPLLFPETVHAAPASHIATLLRNVTLVSSQIGDSSCYLQAMAQAAQWLENDHVNFCLVIGAEEPNWITADALRHFNRDACISAGAGAICLCREPRFSMGVELTAITDAHTYSTVKGRGQAAMAMRNQLDRFAAGRPTGAEKEQTPELLCDGLTNSPRTDGPEIAAWRDWTGARLSPGRILGQGLMAGAAWQCVAACDALANGHFKTAKMSLVGFNQQAIGAEFKVLDNK
jgi:hypothetical protein